MPVEALARHWVEFDVFWILLAVNGTLMRGLALNHDASGRRCDFRARDRHCPSYRLWSIGDRYPAHGPGDQRRRRRRRGSVGGAGRRRSPSILLNEPDGLTIGKAALADGSVVLAVLGEPAACEGQKEITAFGGWRSYISESEKSEG